MPLQQFLKALKSNPKLITFEQTMKTIEEHYLYTDTAFDNGKLKNAAGENIGSCKLFAFAQMQQLTNEQTLNCFGDYYRKDVVQHPQATDHGNIRNFMQYGWEGIKFHAAALHSL